MFEYLLSLILQLLKVYFSHIYLNVPFNYVFLSRLLYSAKGISATDILPVICLGSDVALNKSKFIIIIIIIHIFSSYILFIYLSTHCETKT